MFKRICVIFAFLFALAFFWLTNSASAFGERYPVTEVYSSFCSSEPILCKGKLSYAKNLIRCGEGFYAEKDFDVDGFLLEFSAKTVYIENLKDAVSVYAYSPKIKNFVILFGERVNLHISVGEETIKVATPVIFGSF